MSKKIMWVLLTIVAVAALGATLVVGGWYFITTNVAQPDYNLIVRDGAFEVREYPEMWVAGTKVRGTRNQTVGQGFQRLASYIFAKDRPGEKVAMTAPVIQENLGEGSTPAASLDAGAGRDMLGTDWAVRFIMPAGRDKTDLPQPAGSAIVLDPWHAGRVAAYRFRGTWSDENFQEAESILRNWITTQGYESTGAPIVAYYNDPFTPGFLRRNEVWLRLVDDAAK